MQNDREARKSLGDFFQDVHAKLRICAGFELVCAVAGSDSDGEGVASGAGNELFDFFRTGVGRILSADLDIILDACQGTELSLDDNAVCVCVLNDLLGLRDVLLEGVAGIVDHDRGESAVDAVLSR